MGPAGKTAGDEASKGFASTFGKGVKLAALAAGAGLVAGIAVAAKGISKAIDFDTQMREVFTLMPDITGDAMDEMKGQVKDFSKEFGVLPKDVVPALYQSISAGVPKDNVFGFLETAQRAAKGGVTDLTTAVDGISSVTNAYGADVLNATQASDLMFTAVRLGKTNFEELSSSLFNVTPTAAALGVEFGDVTAALASMTAQGVPTSVATTQLRQLFVELSKEGSGAADMFKEFSGKTFKEFIASGGNVQNALEIMGDRAFESGIGINDMFGSVEAGAAALSLTGANAEGFFNNLQEMGSAAGATEAAFDTMNSGLKPMIDRLKAFGQVALISIGEWFIPKIKQAVSFVEKHWPTISAVVERVRDGVSKAMQWISINVIPPLLAAFQAVVSWVRDNWPQIRATVDSVFDAVRSAFEWVIGNRPVLIGVLTAIGVGFAAWAISAAAAAAATLIAAAPFILIGAAIAAVVAALVYAYQEWDVFREAVDAVREWMVGTLWPAIKVVAQGIADAFGVLVGWVRTHWDEIKATVQAAITIVRTVIETAVGVITAIWERWGDRLTEFARTRWDQIKTLIQAAIDIVKGIIQTVTALIRGDWQGVWDGIKTTLSGVWDAIKVIVQAAIDNVKLILQLGWDLIDTKVTDTWNGIKTFISDTWDAITGFVSDGVSDIIGFVADLPGEVAGAVSGAFGVIWDEFRGVINTIIGAWNGLEFSIPGVSVPGPLPDIPGFTIGTPNIPMLAKGTRNFPGGLAILGEDGPELAYLPRGANVLDNRASKRLMEGGGSAAGSRSVNFGDVHVSDPTTADAIFREANAHLHLL